MTTRKRKGREVEELHAFSSFQDEWNAFPPCVLDIGHCSAEGCAARVFGKGLVILVAWLLTVRRFGVLPEYCVCDFYRWHETEDASLENGVKIRIESV